MGNAGALRGTRTLRDCDAAYESEREQPNASESLPHLQCSRLERLNWRNILSGGHALSLKDCIEMDSYFRHFVAPEDGCVCCGKPLGGGILEQMLGRATFRWGIAHGEGSCRECGYPARAYHRNVGPIKFLQVILQYHPDDLRKPEPPNVGRAKGDAGEDSPQGGAS